MKLLAFADHTNPDSYISKRRRRRMAPFLPLLDQFQEPVRILDIGGTVSFWKNNVPNLQKKCHWTVLNMEKEIAAPVPDVTLVQGDARNLSQFGDKSFDICFSNSVIEHVGTLFDQMAMSREIRRVGRSYFVETPNRYFPIEPHFLVPWWQFGPLWLRSWLLNHMRVGWWYRRPDSLLARAEVEQIRLLNYREMKRLFPEAHIHREKFGPLTKALVAVFSGSRS
jgi:hypothetical protein